MNKQTSLGTYIGQVYDTTLPTADTWFNKLTLQGFENKSAAHARVVSASIAYESGKSAETWKWSSDNASSGDDLSQSSHWQINGGVAPSQKKGQSENNKDYSYKLALFNYNSIRGDSHDVKPGYVVHYFDRVTFGVNSLTFTGNTSNASSWDTIFTQNYSRLYHTGWMVPSYETALDIVHLGTSVLHALSNPGNSFWTCNQNGGSDAYLADMVGGEVKTVSKTTSSWVRPVLWL